METQRSELDGLNRFDRVRARSKANINLDHDRMVVQRMLPEQTPGYYSRLITHIDQEWDVERAIQAGSAGLSLLALLAGGRRSRLLLLLAALGQVFLLQQSILGWSPPVTLLRRLGLRTRGEITAERAALKALRGDFDAIPRLARPAEQVSEALKAAARGG